MAPSLAFVVLGPLGDAMDLGLLDGPGTRSGYVRLRSTVAEEGPKPTDGAQFQHPRHLSYVACTGYCRISLCLGESDLTLYGWGPGGKGSKASAASQLVKGSVLPVHSFSLVLPGVGLRGGL